MALTVTFTVCEAHQLPSSSSLAPSWTGASLFQIKRGEQKAPRHLSLFVGLGQNYNNREALGASRFLDGANRFQYVLAILPGWTDPFCQRTNACESPRAPPTMDPPISC
jgi:hypothetical protein